MRTYTDEEWRREIANRILAGSADVQTDNQGQLVIYTSMFEWRTEIPGAYDIKDEPDPNYDE